MLSTKNTELEAKSYIFRSFSHTRHWDFIAKFEHFKQTALYNLFNHGQNCKKISSFLSLQIYYVLYTLYDFNSHVP